jgi:signal transduction histidine kinase
VVRGANRVERTDNGDLFAEIRELCVVFRAESGMVCRMTIDERHTRFEAVVADAILRNIRRLLANISRVRRGTLVTLSSGTYADGSVFIRIEDDSAGMALPAGEAAAVAQTKPCQFIIIDHRLTQLGGELVIGDHSSSLATIVLPSGPVVDKL